VQKIKNGEKMHTGGENMLKKKIMILTVFLLLTLFIFPLNAVFSDDAKNKPLDPFGSSEIVDMTDFFEANNNWGEGPNKPYIIEHKQELDELKLQKGNSQEESLDIHKWWGAGIYYHYMPFSPYPPIVWGAYAIHYVNLSLTLGTGEERVLYAPTLIPPKPCPLEITTIYACPPSGDMEYWIAVWDHSADPEGWTAWKSFSQAEAQGYLQEDGDLYYYKGLVWYNDTYSKWDAVFYDFDADEWHIWDEQESNSYDNSFGWDMYEAYYEDEWVDTGYIKSKDVLVLRGWTPAVRNWYYLNSSYGYELDNWGGLSLPHDFVHDYYEWYVGNS
jgi:hypothetical protein